MSVRCLLLSAAWACLLPAAMILPAEAFAQSLFLQNPLPDDTQPRPSYRESMKQFPPPGGRFGGGLTEYALTGGRPVPVAPDYAPNVMPNLVKRPYARPGDRPAEYGGVAAGPPRGYPVHERLYQGPVYQERVYQERVYERPVYRRPRALLPQGGLPPYHDGGARGLNTPPIEVAPGISALAPVQPRQVAAAASLQNYSAIASSQAATEAAYGQSSEKLLDFSQPALGGSEPVAQTPIAYGRRASVQGDASQPNLDPLGLGALFGVQPDYAAPAARAPQRAGVDPIYQRQEVAYAGRERPGTVVIDTPDKFLYLVQGNGRALRYGIGVGRPGFTWAGVKTVSRKAEWPGWTPPSEMLKRRPDLPRHMVGGEANPLGARALYLGSSMYRIHGTSEPDTIGTNVSSGCIRMTNADVTDLYERVPVGTKVIVR